MTMIITHISQYGIIHASDSNLTADDKDAGTAQKTFPVTYLDAGLTAAGTYSVSGISMGTWMNSFIDQQGKVADNTLGKFSHALREELQIKMHPNEKSKGCIMHLAGYVEHSGKSHPEFYLVSNVHGINKSTGQYENIDDKFAISEDFWTRDCPKEDLIRKFREEHSFVYHWYINGFPPGRISYNILAERLAKFFEDIWNVSDWKFRGPISLDDVESLVKLYMQAICTLFVLSDYGAHYIGGRVQTYKIPQPLNIVGTCS